MGIKIDKLIFFLLYICLSPFPQLLYQKNAIFISNNHKIYQGCDNIKKLPKIYQNDISKNIRNNEVAYYSKSENKFNQVFDDTMSYGDVKRFLDQIFNGERHAFNIPVIIKTNTRVYNTSLITMNDTYILTYDQDKINIQDIVSIKRKNP